MQHLFLFNLCKTTILAIDYKRHNYVDKSQAAQALAVKRSSCAITVMEKPFLMYVENLEMDNLLKWALFIKVSGQIANDTLWKEGEVFFIENLTHFFYSFKRS